MTRHEIELADGRRLVVHLTGPAAGSSLTLLWHHGSPQTGAVIAPIAAAAEERGIRVLSVARPSYGGSSPDPGRTVASAARDLRAVLDALAVDHVVTMGASGGGPHALACAAVMPERVRAAVAIASPSPYTGDPAWFEGMAAPGGLQSALRGRDDRAAFAETDQFDETQFVDVDWAALAGTWQDLGRDAAAADADGPDGLIDDDVAFASPWGVELEAVGVPVLIVQGGRDRVIPPSHARHLLELIPMAELWLRPGDGHVSVLDAVPPALDWLRDRVRSTLA